MRQTTVSKTAMAAAASRAGEGSFCASCANIALLLDAALLASIFVALITLMGLISLLSLIRLLALLLVLAHLRTHPKEAGSPSV